MDMQQRVRKTKIICTLGPASNTIESIRLLLKAGMNIARFNCSHGTHDGHRAHIEMARQASGETGIPLAIMLDTKGPEIRTRPVKEKGILKLLPDSVVKLTADTVESTEERIAITYEPLLNVVSIGQHIYIADGLIDIEVTGFEENNALCRVCSGGIIESRKNVNIPGIDLGLPSISDNDRKDILFGLDMEIDFIAASFVRKPENIADIRDIIIERKQSTRIIAKIENHEGIANLEEIVQASDGVMVARGDLGVQLDTAQIPIVQKRIIAICNRHNKPTIIATQMLDSMIRNPRPTRAELTDVANAIFDGASALMLSGETANGKYPVPAVTMLHNIAIEVEPSSEYRVLRRYPDPSDNIGDAVARSACLLAEQVGASAIVAPTLRGNTPRIINQFFPNAPVIAVTPSERVARHLLLEWGVYSVPIDEANDSETMARQAISAALKRGYIAISDTVVTVARIPIQSPNPVNSIQVHFIATNEDEMSVYDGIS